MIYMTQDVSVVWDPGAWVVTESDELYNIAIMSDDCDEVEVDVFVSSSDLEGLAEVWLCPPGEDEERVFVPFEGDVDEALCNALSVILQ